MTPEFSAAYPLPEGPVSPGNRLLAVQYLATASRWVLEPALVTVEQPPNQQYLLKNLAAMLKGQNGGERLAEHLGHNVELLQNVAAASGRRWEAVHIKCDYKPPSDGVGLSSTEQAILQRLGSSTKEYLSSSVPQVPNVMVAGLLEVTGAQVLRDDFAEGNDEGERIHKGMFAGKPVYFVEYVVHPDRPPEALSTPLFRQTVWLMTEVVTREALESLSGRDTQLLDMLGVRQQSLFTRSRLVEFLKTYVEASPA